MKKVFYFGMFAMIMLLATACSPSSPGAVAKKYAEYLKDGKYEKFVDAIAIDAEADEAKIKEEKAGLAAMLKEKGTKQLEKKGGIKNIEIVSETIAEDENSAKVVLKQTFGDETTQENTFNMVKKDGEWKINAKK